MTDAEIQAIVGFLRQWEATALEVAQPMGLLSSMGGQPRLRNQVTVTPVPDTGTTLDLNAAVAETPFPPGQMILEPDMATHIAQEAANGGGD